MSKKVCEPKRRKFTQGPVGEVPLSKGDQRRRGLPQGRKIKEQNEPTVIEKSSHKPQPRPPLPSNLHKEVVRPSIDCQSFPYSAQFYRSIDLPGSLRTNGPWTRGSRDEYCNTVVHCRSGVGWSGGPHWFVVLGLRPA